MANDSSVNDTGGDRHRQTHGGRLHRLLVSPAATEPKNPALAKHSKERAKDVQNRLADAITRFAGSMAFVYLHIVWFGCWIGFGAETYPFGLLTMLVSLEAIFLSTFILISQNRADAKRQVIADQQWTTVQQEEQQNEELLQLMKQTHTLVKEVHSASEVAAPSDPAASIRIDDPAPARRNDREG